MKELKTLLIKGNDYIYYTINHYIDCYDKLDIKQIKTLSGLFDELKVSLLKEKNVRDENKMINPGFELKKKEKISNELRSVKGILYNINSVINESKYVDSKDISFLESITKLAYACDFMNNDELYILNSLFDKIILFDYELSNPIQKEDKVLYTKVNNIRKTN